MAFSLGVHITLAVTPATRPPGYSPPPPAPPLMVTLEHPPAVPESATSPREPNHSYPERAPLTDPPGVRAGAPRGSRDIHRPQTTAIRVPERDDTDGVPLPQRESGEYYTAQELDVYPALRQPLRLNGKSMTTAGARRAVLLTLDETGVVEHFAIIDGSPEGEAYLEQVLRAARFSPGLKDGRPVKSRIVLGIEPGGASSSREP